MSQCTSIWYISLCSTCSPGTQKPQPPECSANRRQSINQCRE